MQINKPRKYQGSKFAEGRLKLSTACTECHKRKQKCDQKQPCRHCARRYPQPECIYRRKGEDAARTGSLDARESGEVVLSVSSSTSSSNGEEVSRGSSLSNGHYRESNGLNDESENYQDNEIETELSPGSPPEFDKNSYQNSLSTMISRMSEVKVEKDVEITLPVSSNVKYREVVLSKRHRAQQMRTPYYSKTITVEPLHFLGIKPTLEKAALLSAFVKILVKYTVSLDGNPIPNYYNSHFVPWSIKSPLLSNVSIFFTACFQSEAQKIPPNTSPLVLSYKLETISLLNQMLRSKNAAEATSNEAIAAVSIMVAGEWYWSDYETVKMHLRGLAEMVRLRGGLGELEMHDFLKQMILIIDYNTAVTYACELSFPHNVAILPRHPPHMMTPLLSSSGVTYTSHAKALDLSNETAMILDDIRFLLLATIRQVDRPTTAQERAKLQITAKWTRDRIISLPTGNEPESHLANDVLYNCCRISALIFSRAIVEHIPLSKACTLQDLALLWANMWSITLTRWKQIPGIFLWIILSAIQGAEETPYGRFLKSMLKAACTYMALDYWDVVDGSCMGFIRLQRWLRTGILPEEVQKGEGEGEVEMLDFLHVYKEGDADAILLRKAGAESESTTA